MLGTHHTLGKFKKNALDRKQTFSSGKKSSSKYISKYVSEGFAETLQSIKDSSGKDSQCHSTENTQRGDPLGLKSFSCVYTPQTFKLKTSKTFSRLFSINHKPNQEACC